MKTLKKVGLFLVVFAAFSVIFSLTHTQKAHAQSALASDYGISFVNNKPDIKDFTITWQDAGHIIVKFSKAGSAPIVFTAYPIQNNGGGNIYDERMVGWDSDLSDCGNVDSCDGIFRYEASDFECTARLTADLDAGASDKTKLSKTINNMQLTLELKESTGGECVGGNKPKADTINPDLSKAYFVWVDSANISTSDGDKPGTFHKSDIPNVYIRVDDSGNKCADKLLLDPATNTVKWYELASSGTDNYGGSPPSVLQAGDCKYHNGGYSNSGDTTWQLTGYPLPTNDVAWPLGLSENKTKAPDTGTPVDGGGPGAGIGDIGHVDCAWSINPITWLLCPLLDLTQSIIRYFDSIIQQYLELNTSYFDEGGTTGAAYYSAWSAFRVIAMSLLLIIGLVMVISQALGMGVFDAYTIKRVLPRMAIAVIGISLSWQFMKATVGLSNVAGEGVRALIYTPFRSLPNPSISGTTLTSGLLAGGAIAGSLGILGTLSFAGTAAMALLVGLAVVILRQILVTLLAILAPIGIVAFILPNTQRFWKMWHENFSRALLAFPIITGFIAIGTVFGKVAASGQANNSGLPGSFAQIVSFVAVYAPYFMLPLAFRLAGGAIANIAGFANDKGKGGFDRLKKFRGDERKKTAERAEGHQYMKGGDDTNFRGKINQRIAQAMHARSAFDTGITDSLKGGNWKANVNTAMGASAMRHRAHIMEDERLAHLLKYDDLTGATNDVFNNSVAGIRKRLAMKGVGGKEILDKDGNGTGKFEAVRGEDGEILIQDEAKLNLEVSKITAHMEAGDKRAALEQMLKTTGAYSYDENDTDLGRKNAAENEIRAATSGMIAASRRYGQDALSQVLVKSAAGGGTYYDDAADAWLAAGLATRNDSNARSEMAGSLRGILTNAGRADQGGGSFGTTMKFMQDLDSALKGATSADGTFDMSKMESAMGGLQEDYQAHVIGNTAASTLFHPQMKEGYAKNNIMPVMRKQLQKAAEDAKANPDNAGMQALYKQKLAEADNVYQYALATKPAMAKVIGDELMNMELPDEVETFEERETGIVDPTSGKPMTMRVSTGKQKLTVRSAGSQYKYDPDWLRYHKEYGAEQYDRMGRMPPPGGPGGAAPTPPPMTGAGGGPV